MNIILDASPNFSSLRLIKQSLFARLAEQEGRCMYYDCGRKSDILRKNALNIESFNTHIIHIPGFQRLLVLLLGFLGCLSSVIRFALICSSIIVRSEYSVKASILSFRAYGVVLGDAICSTYLRRNDITGSLAVNLKLFVCGLRVIVKSSFIDAFIGIIDRSGHQGARIFFALETTYISDAIRKIAMLHGFRELRYDEYRGKFSLQPVTQGSDIRKPAATIINYYERVTAEQCKLGAERLRQFVDREKKYWYMTSDIDIDGSIQFDFDNKAFDKPVAIVYMHAVSDAQYVYGVDCFVDLDDWLQYTLQTLNRLGYITCVKLHPSFFRENNPYVSDLTYLKRLSVLWGVDLFTVPPDTVKMLDPDLFVIGHKVSLKALKAWKPEAVVITHHGTVASEAAFLQMPSIVSEASPYLRGYDTFVDLYSTKTEYTQHLINWRDEYKLYKNDQSVNAYCYVHFVLKEEYSMTLSPYEEFAPARTANSQTEIQVTRAFDDYLDSLNPVGDEATTILLQLEKYMERKCFALQN